MGANISPGKIQGWPVRTQRDAVRTLAIREMQIYIEEHLPATRRL
jgi:hypothetical protein